VAEEIAVPETGRNLRELARYIIGVAIGLLVLLLLAGRRAELLAAWHQLSHVAAGWVVAAAAAETASLWLFALLQHRALRLSGSVIAMPGLFLLTLANDAIANTVPGEPAVSSAYRYRFYRRHGATAAAAGWTIFTVLIAQAIGMSLVLLAGVLVALAGSAGGQHTATALAGLVIVAGAVAVLVRRDLVLRLASGLVRALRRVSGLRVSAGRADGLGARIEATLERMREIPLSPRSTAGIVTLAAGVWLADFGTLLCAFRAVHAPIPLTGVLLAYGVAQVAGTLPVVPGGIGIVEGSLAVILVAYGANRASALSAALAFRAVSFWLAVAIGWIAVGVIARLARRPGQGPGDPVVEVPAG
jgi:uncharacterized protein (TIRG00374 family)